IEDIRLDPNGDPAFRLVDAPSEVLAGGRERIRVVVRPQLVSTITTTLIVQGEPDALPVPLVEVPITVEATDLGLPRMVVDPECVEFSRIGQFDVAFSHVTVRNEGVRDLILDEVF